VLAVTIAASQIKLSLVFSFDNAMNQKRFAPLVVHEEIEVIETRLVEEEVGEISLISSFTEVTVSGHGSTASNLNGNINVYLDLLNDWKKLALEELKSILDDYAQTTTQFQILQSYNPRTPPSYASEREEARRVSECLFICYSLPSSGLFGLTCRWLVIDYAIDPSFDENDEFATKFEAAKKEFLRKGTSGLV
jgi:hypothetical protein